jgi:hypothetical protein
MAAHPAGRSESRSAWGGSGRSFGLLGGYGWARDHLCWVPRGPPFGRSPRGQKST